MKRLTLAASTTLLAVALPGVAQARLSHSEAVAYGRAYAHVEHALGHGTAGCKLIGPQASCRRSSDSMVRRSTDTLHRMLAPAPVYHHAAAVVPSTTTATGSNVSYSGGGGGGGVPACASESGTNYSTGPDNTNPSGATGRYQIMPSTAAGYGCNLSTPAGQDACASVIYAHQGAGAWVGCGG